MDMMTGLLEGPKARGALLLKSVFNPPWAVRIEDRAPLTVLTLVRGSGWLLPDDAPASAWSDAVQSLLVEPALAAQLGATARGVLDREHDSARIADATLALIERARAGRG